MSKSFKLACIQNCADDNTDKNIKQVTDLIHAAHQQGAQLICTAENFSCIAANDRATLALALPYDKHPVIEHYTALAKQLGIYLLLGSISIRISEIKVNNRSLLINPLGQVIAQYNKLHLFDVSLSAAENYHESKTVAPGKRAVLAQLPWGKLGMSICYDLRFPQLYRSLAQQGADFLSVPAAFTFTTGIAHWHTLLSARAIETGSYVFAAAQTGTRSTGRRCYGHSLIIDPWGQVLADAGTEVGFILADIDPILVQQIRLRLPSLNHDQHFML